LLPPGDGGDHAVEQSPGGDAGPPAAAVDAHGAVEVGGRVEVAQVKPQQKPAQISLPGVVAPRPEPP
jgi:hypothetical protein